jgi:hypothetical protein
MRLTSKTRSATFLTPLVTFSALTAACAIYAGGCGGTDTIDDDAGPVDSMVEDTAVDAPGAETVDSTVDSTMADVADSGSPPDALPDVLAEVRPDALPDVVTDVRDSISDVDASDAPPSMVPSLGAAASFAVLGGSTVTNTGLSIVNGNLGVWPGLAVTGFPPGQVVGGTVDPGGPTSQAAQASLTALYNSLKGAACGTVMTSIDLSGKTLEPGVYCFASSAAISTVGTLTLDAKGDPNAFWIFQVGSTFTTPNGAAVTVINGGSACNVFWQVGSSVTIGKDNLFGGNLVAFSSITVMTGSNVLGRALARNGAVTLDTNSIANTACVGGMTTDAGVDAPDVADAMDATDVADAADAADGG